MLDWFSQFATAQTVSTAIAIAAFVLSIYSISLSRKTMVLLHRPFVGVMQIGTRFVKLAGNTRGITPLPLGTGIPLDKIENLEFGLVVKNTGAAGVENLASQLHWFLEKKNWSDPKGGLSEIIPQQEHTLWSAIKGDTIRAMATGKNVKGRIDFSYKNPFGEEFQSVYYFDVGLTWNDEQKLLFDIVLRLRTKDAWLAIN